MRFALPALLAVLIGSQATAMTIPEGKYQLKWKPAMDQSHSDRYHCYVSLQDLKDFENRKIIGVSSDNAKWAICERILAVVDESKGTGTGYDVVHLVLDAPKTGDIDVKKARDIKLYRGDGSNLDSTGDELPMLDWVMGTPGAQATRQMGVFVEVERWDSDSGKLTPNSIMVSTLGGWYGRIETDAGPVRVEPRDNTNNNIYNDPPATNGPSDTVDIYSRKEWSSHTEMGLDRATLGTAALIDGKLYVVRVSPGGDEVEFRHYRGDTGKVKVDAVDGHGKPLVWDSLSLDGAAGSFSLDRRKLAAAAIPPGQYRARLSLYLTAKLTKDGVPSNYFSVYVYPDKKLEVDKDKTATLRVGGEISVNIGTDERAPTLAGDLIKVSRGQCESIVVGFSIGGDRIDGGGSTAADWKPVITIKDAAGKAVYPGPARNYFGSNYIGIADAWPNGNYTIEVKLNTGSYQKPLFVKKKLLITD